MTKMLSIVLLVTIAGLAFADNNNEVVESSLADCNNPESLEYEGKAISVFRCKLNWEAARTKCNAEGKVLMKVSSSIQGTLDEKTESDASFWTAATNRYKNDPGTWEWADHSENATEAAKGQNSPRSCLVYENGKKLKAKNCFTTLKEFICVAKASPSQVGPRENLAFSAVANYISHGHGHGCPWRAVDEDTGTDFEKNTCAISEQVADPWFAVGFGSKKRISEVAITARSKPEEEQDAQYEALSDFKVAVADTFDWQNVNVDDWTECGSFSGAMLSGERVSIPCEAEGAYVGIYVPGKTASIQICNFEVYA